MVIEAAPAFHPPSSPKRGEALPAAAARRKGSRDESPEARGLRGRKVFNWNRAPLPMLIDPD
jgi:hypothetical protein